MKAPRPVLDMGVPSRGIWSRIAMTVAQAEVISPAAAFARLTARSYGGNLREYETTHIWEAADLISPVAESKDRDGLSNGEFEMLEGRLQLKGRMFGGLVSDEALPRFEEKYQTSRAENRGHNWELLRQTAEENGLYFQPLAVGGMGDSFAMVWVAREDLQSGPGRFNSKFLKIASPFGDDRIANWNGYSEMWDMEGRQMSMIPLALYALDYPHVPFLLGDFRRPAGPGLTERTLRFSDDITTCALSLTGFGLAKFGYLALKSSWLFVQNRHGAATNRDARRRAFVQLRHALGTDDTLDPELRAQLARRVGKLDIDPMDRSWKQEVRDAWRQYDALLNSAADPKGLPKLLAADREQEARTMAHGLVARAGLRAVAVASLGLYHHEEKLTPGKMEEIAGQRRIALLKRTAPLPEAAQHAGGEN